MFVNMRTDRRLCEILNVRSQMFETEEMTCEYIYTYIVDAVRIFVGCIYIWGFVTQF